MFSILKKIKDRIKERREEDRTFWKGVTEEPFERRDNPCLTSQMRERNDPELCEWLRKMSVVPSKKLAK